ncbi:MAG: hypothetical protein Q9213_000050 [Squamulea squamosa]
MAKGLRSSVKKANRSRLRSKVFGPVEEARKQRLSAKLLSKTLEPTPNAKEDAALLDDSLHPPVKFNTSPAHGDSFMRVHSTEFSSERTQIIPEDGNRSMDLDPPSKPISSAERHHQATSKSRKPRRRKTQSAMVFRVSGKGKPSGIRKRRKV